MAEAQGKSYYNSLSFFKKLPPDHTIEYEGKRYTVSKLVEMLKRIEQEKSEKNPETKKKALIYNGNSIEYWRNN